MRADVPYSLFVMLMLVFVAIPAEGHQIFNSESEKIGGYNIQVATDPEIPGPGSPSRVMVAITDSDGGDLADVNAGVRIFKDDRLLYESMPGIYPNGHFDLQFAFPESGMYMVEVTVKDQTGREISSKFNLGIIQTFGYIFYAMVMVGVFTPVCIIAGIYIVKKRRARLQS